ncbi:hypothetical protein [Stenotrophomonas geniculata]|uniref:hypothetical protein n=1 Tax=Stenotrophomonas geniculata TaxID=86188 RepID=UPI000B0E4048|nr:hypothetical protein [Stenotrophomonas geniculata]
MIRDFASLDEAAHYLYLAEKPGPVRCRVDGSVWDVWRDGRSVFVQDGEVA